MCVLLYKALNETASDFFDSSSGIPEGYSLLYVSAGKNSTASVGEMPKQSPSTLLEGETPRCLLLGL